MLKTEPAVQVGGATLTIHDVIDVAYSAPPIVEVAPSVGKRLEEIRGYVEERVTAAVNGASGGKDQPMKRSAIYGVTTGFGALKSEFLKSADAAKRLQANVIISHSGGTGTPFSDEVVRAIMLLRAHTLARGYSGVRPELLERLLKMLNADVLPVIPEQGSVGCSGDLAPLAHLGLGLIGEGPVRFNGSEHKNLKALKQKAPSHPALAALEDTFQLSYKEGLGLVNGISVTTALAALNVHRSRHLLLWADVIGSMTAEAILAAPRAFDQIVFDVIYAHKSAAISAANVRAMTQGSTLINASPDVHDAYSVRCIPQVHGAARETLKFVESAVTSHLNSVDDDPVFFTQKEVEAAKPVDGWLDRLHFEDGHFHGAPVGYAMDFLGIAMADLGSISERRIAMLVDKNYNRGGNEVPAFLTYDPEHTTSGVMLAQYTAAALVSENKTLAHPASVDSIPTSANHEDHVSMSTWAARKARSILANLESVLAIELLCASLALAFRVGDLKSDGATTREWKMGAGTRAVYQEVKKKLEDFAPFNRRDCVLHEQIELLKKVLRSEPPAKVELAK